MVRAGELQRNKEELFLPGASWSEDALVSSSKGTKLRRWGSVEAACKMLDDCDRHDIYVLIQARQIRGYKLKPWAANSKWKVDLLSVWEFKQRQLV